MGEWNLNSELLKRLNRINEHLETSQSSFSLISNYLEYLSRDLFLVNNALEDDTSTISRSMADSWSCKITRQIEANLKLTSIVNKMIEICAQDQNVVELRKYAERIADADASICDGYAKGGANRPVDGLMPCLMPKQLGREVTELEILSVTMPKNWSDWNNRFNHHINIINEFVMLFPASHAFASLPCSLSVILTQVKRSIQEQSKLEYLLDVLTSGQEENDYSSVFGIDVILIKQLLRPVPVILGEDE